MGLSQQIIWLMSFLLIAVFGGTFSFSVHNARVYLNHQLGTHAQDTATAMAVSLSGRGGEEAPLAASLVDAIADSGFYRLVRVEDDHGGVIAQREIHVRVEGVPDWFMRLVPLDTPVREAPVQAGWRQHGRVVVSSHPGYAYERLWLDAGSALMWFLGASALAAALAAMLIRYALRPLHGMVAQAADIGEGRFTLNQEVPRTPELRRIAFALNHLSAKVESLFSAKVEVIKRLEREVTLDDVTGVLNRLHFDSRVCLLLRRVQGAARSALFIVRLTGLAEYNAHYGYRAGNELLAATAKLLSNLAERFDGSLVGRLGGAELGLFLSAVKDEEIYEIAPEILRQMKRLSAAGCDASISNAHLGVGIEQAALDANGSSLLARADMALRSAESWGMFAWRASVSQPASAEIIMGSTAWRGLLRDTLHNRDLRLCAQPVLGCHDRLLLQQEISGCIAGPDGRLIPGDVYLPLAQRFKMASALDRLLIELALARPIGGVRGRHAFRLTYGALQDIEMRSWLGQVLREPEWAGRVALEFAEPAAAAAPDLILDWINRFRPLGIGFGLFGVGREARLLDVIKRLPLDYLKLDPMFSAELEHEWPESAYVVSVVELAHDLDRMVIATGVDTDLQMARVTELGFDGMQGNHVMLAVPI